MNDITDKGIILQTISFTGWSKLKNIKYFKKPKKGIVTLILFPTMLILPVKAYNHICHIKNGKNGLLIKPKDPNELSKAIIKVLSSKDIQKTILARRIPQKP